MPVPVATPRRLATGILAAVTAAAAGLAGCTVDAPVTEELSARWDGASLYDLEVTDLAGERVSLGAYRGSVTLVVNTASQCGLTPQYEGLQALQEQYADRGFSVLGFPSDSFNQEFDSNDEIRAFCTDRYAVTFPLFSPVSVKAGDGQSPVYEMLGTETGKLPGWNFGKYLVDADGRPIAYFDSRTGPGDASLVAAIETALSASAASGG